MSTLRLELVKLASFTAKVVVVSILVVLTAGLLVLLFADDLDGDSYTNKRTLTVTGTAKEKITPDSARITLGKNIRGKNPVTVQTEASTAINKLVTEVKKLGVAEEKIATSNYALTPIYNQKNDVESYEVNISVTVTLEKSNPKDEMPSKIIAAGTTAGINDVRGLSFYVSDQDELTKELQEKAIADAKDQAKKRAKAASIKLGKVLSIGGSDFYYYDGTDRGESVGGGAGAPTAPVPDKEDNDGGGVVINPGEYELQNSVTLVFEVK